MQKYSLCFLVNAAPQLIDPNELRPSQGKKVVNRESAALETTAKRVSTLNWVSVPAAKWRTLSSSAQEKKKKNEADSQK